MFLVWRDFKKYIKKLWNNFTAENTGDSTTPNSKSVLFNFIIYYEIKIKNKNIMELFAYLLEKVRDIKLLIMIPLVEKYKINN